MAVGIGSSAAEGFVWSGDEGFGGTFLADFVDCLPNPLLHVLLHFCKWGSTVPTCNICSLSGGIHHSGDCCYLGWCFCLHGGSDVGTGAGGIGKSFWVSNRFSEVDCALGQRVPSLTGAFGMSSKWGGFWTEVCPLFWGLAIGLEASTNCPVASLCIVTGMPGAANPVVCIWVDVVAVVVAVIVVGVGCLGLLLYILSWLLLSFFFCHLPLGFVLGWAGCDCVCCGWFCVDWVWDRGLGFGPCLPSYSR